jgi:hypothetical protein
MNNINYKNPKKIKINGYKRNFLINKIIYTVIIPYHHLPLSNCWTT